MKNNGQALEALVAYVEKTLSNEGFQVEVNRTVHNDDGVQVAEFDVIVEGRFGSTDISWLIECRDRPSSGKAPGEWIHALAGKRDVHRFDKVTAVSTTGFSPAAVLAAEKLDVELREVTATTPDTLDSWLRVAEIELVQHDLSLGDIDFVLDKSFATPARERYVKQLLSDPEGRQKVVLVSGIDGSEFGVHAACREALAVAEQMDALELGESAVEIDMEVGYEAENAHLHMKTPDGNIRIRRIRYKGSVRAILRKFPLTGHAEYRRIGYRGTLAQTANAQVLLPSGEMVTFTFTKVSEHDQFQISWKSES
jgi:hypothetical protein